MISIFKNAIVMVPGVHMGDSVNTDSDKG